MESLSKEDNFTWNAEGVLQYFNYEMCLCVSTVAKNGKSGFIVTVPEVLSLTYA